MGYTTDFIGHIDIMPPLNVAEQAYLTAFAKSRRWARPRGPYDVPANPAAERDEEDQVGDIDGHDETAPGQPGLWCGWVPCWDGCCLAHDGVEKFYQPTRWMTYLIDHFLRPGAAASTSGLPWFKGFTFDHAADGIVAACRRDNKELYLICVDDNEVSEEILVPPDPRYVDWPPLPYEDEIDRWEQRRARRRRPRRVRRG